MLTQIDYCILAVHYGTHNGHREHIEDVITNTALSRSLPTIKTKDEVVRDINFLNKSICTAPSENGMLRKGARVITELIDGVWYIKTVRDNTRCDNLSDLPEY